MNEMDTRFANQYNIQWFPGHMTKTLRMMEQEIQHVDASLVLLDARIPLSSLNPEIERITSDKPHLYIMNKADLADPDITAQWLAYFKSAGAGCLPMNSKQSGKAGAVKGPIEKELSTLMERRRKKGMIGARIRVMVVGIPNVGKSTLMNAMVGEKIAIVSSRPQTTRNRIMGVMTRPDWQIVFLDTPGIHTPRTKLGESMMQSVKDAMDGMDGVLVLVDATQVGEHDRAIVRDMAGKKVPKVLAINKIDLLPPEKLLGLIASFADLGYDAIIPISAKTGDGLDDLTKQLATHLPEGPKYFPDDMMTDQPERLICAELIREKALQHLRDEVPHGIGVEMMGMEKMNDNFMEINATIYCERDAHKGIIIGKHGAMLQTIGSEAREDIEKLLGLHVNLKLWVKVRPDWRNRASDLRTLGYDAK